MKPTLFKYTGANYSPSLVNHLPDKNYKFETLSQLDLFNGLKSEPANKDELAKHYKAAAEIYALNFDNTIEACNALINSDGVISEMYLEVYTHEQSKGESARSVRQKDRLLIVQKSIELLRKYFNKYEQCKLMLKNSLDERSNLLNKVIEQQKTIEQLKKQLNF